MFAHKIKKPYCRYEFQIKMGENNTYTAYVWDKEDYPYKGIVQSLYNVTLAEAEAFIEERAQFLGKTEYTIEKTLDKYN